MARASPLECRGIDYGPDTVALVVPHDPTSDTALLNEATAAATALDWKLQDPVNIPVLGLPDITHAESREEGPSAGRRAPATVPP